MSGTKRCICFSTCSHFAHVDVPEEHKFQFPARPGVGLQIKDCADIQVRPCGHNRVIHPRHGVLPFRRNSGVHSKRPIMAIRVDRKVKTIVDESDTVARQAIRTKLNCPKSGPEGLKRLGYGGADRPSRPYFSTLRKVREIEITSEKFEILVITCCRCSVSFTSMVTLISAVWLGSVLIRAAETFV